MGLAIQTTIEYETMECGECGILFALSMSFYRERKELGKAWYCPNGHSRVFRESVVEKLRKDLEAERKRRIEPWDRANRAEAEVEKARRKLSRVGKGVCPWCKRSFQNLKRHVACKHPNQAEARG